MRLSRREVVSGLAAFAALPAAKGFNFSKGSGVETQYGLRRNRCLWPAPFNERTPEVASSFIRELRTWNESEGELQFFPDKEYFPVIDRSWIECRLSGEPLILEKSRRLVTSNRCRALELFDLGLQRGDWVITHLTSDDAQDHVWRIWNMFEDLRARRPDWKLPPSKPYGRLAEKLLEGLVLPNGSTVSNHYEQPKGLQGKGKAGVTLEELSLYRLPALMYSQAQYITQASAGARNGLVVVVTNASPNQDWQLVKGKQPAMPAAA